MIVLDAEAVRELHPMAESVEVMRQALRTFSAGGVVQPQRAMLRTPDGDALAVMPAYVSPSPQSAYAGFGVKVVAVKPGNPALGLDAHYGVVLVLDERTGKPAALLDGGAVTAVRTAAVSAVATDVLARPDAGRLALLGSGVQARTHLEAMAEVRDLRGARVWSRDPVRAAGFADWAAGQDFGFPVEPATTVADAVAEADIVCTLTATTDPLLDAAHVREGAHINAVGSSFPDKRELTGQLVARCAVFVDSRTAALTESGDLRIPIAEGLIAEDSVRAEIGEVLLGRAPGRTSPAETTLFVSLGLAVEDVLSGFATARRAREQGVGVNVTLFPEA